MIKRTITLDVREDIRLGREPFGKIMQVVTALKGDQQLRLLAPFEPAPLYAVLAQRGYDHQSKATPEGDFEVLFTRGSSESARPEATAAPPQASSGPTSRACAGIPVIEVDARGLEPPQPLVKILEALAALPEGARLRARTDRRPMHLYAQLEERGFLGESKEQSDGSFITHVRRG
jgi:uncharacterized protein (DUF2249 family)